MTKTCPDCHATVLSTSQPERMSELKDSVLGAVARGWCSRANEHKEMDADLASAIFTEVWAEVAAALAATPAVGGEALRDAIMGAARLYTHDHATAHKITEAAMATLAAPPASPLRAAMKRIEAVCEDNAAASCDHKLALDFVLQIATAAIPPEQPAAAPFQPHENCNCLMCLAEKPR